jgi:DNA-binding MarR family transcriptional regulator
MTPESLRVLGALRRMAQALDTHSKYLENSADLTVPQLLVLEALRVAEGASLNAGTLASRISLTQGTVTSILDRLEQKQLVTRTRALDDRRRVLVALTTRGHAALSAAPPLLQTHFVRAFEQLPAEVRASLLDALDRLVGLMQLPAADSNDDAPMLPPAA